MSRNKRVDSNQKELVKQIRSLGMSVQILSMVGEGCTDLLVGFKKVNYLFEVKDGSKSPSKRKLTPDQIKLHGSWRGQIDVVHNIDDVLKIVNNGK